MIQNFFKTKNNHFLKNLSIIKRFFFEIYKITPQNNLFGNKKLGILENCDNTFYTYFYYNYCLYAFNSNFIYTTNMFNILSYKMLQSFFSEIFLNSRHIFLYDFLKMEHQLSFLKIPDWTIPYGHRGIDIINWRYLFIKKRLFADNPQFATPISKNYLHSLFFMNHLRPYELDVYFKQYMLRFLIDFNYNYYKTYSIIWPCVDKTPLLDFLLNRNLYIMHQLWLYYLWKNRYFFPLKSHPMIFWHISFKWYLLRLKFKVNPLLDVVNIEHGPDNLLFDKILKNLYKYFYYPYFGWWFEKYFDPVFKNFHHHYFSFIVNVTSVYKFFYLKEVNYNINNKNVFYNFTIKKIAVCYLGVFSDLCGIFYNIYTKVWRFWEDGYFAMSFIFYYLWKWSFKNQFFNYLHKKFIEIGIFLYYVWVPGYFFWQWIYLCCCELVWFYKHIYNFFDTHPVLGFLIRFLYVHFRRLVTMWLHFNRLFTEWFYIAWAYVVPYSLVYYNKLRSNLSFFILHDYHIIFFIYKKLKDSNIISVLRDFYDTKLKILLKYINFYPNLFYPFHVFRYFLIKYISYLNFLPQSFNWTLWISSLSFLCVFYSQVYTLVGVFYLNPYNSILDLVNYFTIFHWLEYFQIWPYDNILLSVEHVDTCVNEISCVKENQENIKECIDVNNAMYILLYGLCFVAVLSTVVVFNCVDISVV